MDIKSIILVSIASLNLALGAVIFFHNSKSIMNRWFALFALSLAAWSLGMMMYAKDQYSWQNIYEWSLILHLAGTFIAFSFFRFALVYPQEKMPISSVWNFLFFVPLFAVFYFLFIDKLIIIDLKILPDNKQLIYGPLYPIYFISFFTYMGSGLTMLLKKSFEIKGPTRVQARTIFLGVLVALIPPAIINMVLAAVGDFRYAWTGPIFLLIVLFFITYSIIKLKFLDIKVIATEIFAVFLALITAIEIFTYKSPEELIAKSIIFVITLIFAILLIRSVLKEVKRREEMEVLTQKLQKATKKLESANKELQRLDDAKSEFLSIASHQLRTPLTAIRGYSSMLLEGSFGAMTDKVKMAVERVMFSSERLITLVEDLLDISRIEAGRLELNIQPVDLAETAKTIIEEFQQKAKERKLKLGFFPEPKLPKVLTDPQKIKDVISNLIDNSIKYTEKGEVIVGLHQESQSVVFSCQDTGRGIEPDDLPRLFNKFVRGKGMMQVYTEGTGLGLYFARMLIENMGGRIWAESPGKGQGSKFSFSLPLADKSKAKKVK